jgi:Cu+-exporting ATPase
MLLSFPEYLAIDASSGALKQLFGYLIILLSVPVFFYCSSEYFQSAYGGLKAGIVNIDIPLSLGIIAFYVRSLYEILSGTGAGYMDSFAGLIFFLLLGKIFQNKTFDVLNFERDYRSYFPISVTRKRGQSEYAVPLEKIVMGDRLVIRNNELIPADAVLVQGTAHLDYSFITGESETITKRSGELVYAGGIQVGNAIEITVAKNVEQSYLTQLWNESNIEPGLKQNLVAFSANVSRYFTLALLTIAAASFFYWAQFSIASALNAFSAVLIIACPCALALSVPFAFGNALRHLSRAGMFLKNINIIEKLSNVTTIIFDKTGTLTTPAGKSAVFTGGVLSRQQEEYAYSLCRSSTHPLSRAIARMYSNCEALPVENFREIEGDGIEGFINGKYIKLGRLSYIQQSLTSYDYPAEIPDIISGVHYSIDGVYVGYFGFKSVYREGVRNLIEHLKRRYAVVVLSGDTIQEKETLQSLIGEDIPMRFSQSPYDKLTAVQERQRGDETVLVIGDGLNDSGALRQADVGISVSEDVLSFSPASDSILRANSLMKIDRFLQYCRDTIKTVVLSFVISTGYNIFGLYYAVTGKITPFFAAVLMPLSSVTVIALTVFATTIFAKRRGIGS